jgi:hypothetical protein
MHPANRILVACCVLCGLEFFTCWLFSHPIAVFHLLSSPSFIPHSFYSSFPVICHNIFYVHTRVCLSVSVCLSSSVTETPLYVSRNVPVNILGARVLPGNLSAQYTGMWANPIRPPGTVHCQFCNPVAKS